MSPLTLASYTNRYYVFATGKEGREISDRRVLDAYIHEIKNTDQPELCMFPEEGKYVVKSANK